MKLNIPRAKKPSSEEIVQQRIARTIRILGLLNAGPIYNTTRLAEEFSVSRRTVFRDIRALREAGIPIRIDKWSEAYYVRAQREPGQIPLENNQVVMLALAAHLSPLNCSPQQAAKIRSAISALISRLPHSTRFEVGRLLSRIQGETYSMPNPILERVLHALRKKQPIYVLLETTRGVYENLEITPCQLVASVDGWQLLGRVETDRNERSFNVGSFLQVELVDCSPNLISTRDHETGEAPTTHCKLFKHDFHRSESAKAGDLACSS